MRHPMRTLLVLLATALGVSAMVATFSVDEQVFGAFAAVRGHLRTTAPLTVRGISGAVPLEARRRVAGTPGVSAAIPFASTSVETRSPEGARLLLAGVPWDAARTFVESLGKRQRLELHPGVLRLGDLPLVMERKGAQVLGLNAGDEVVVPAPDGARSLRVAGFFDGGPLAEATGGLVGITTLEVVSGITGVSGVCDRMDVFPEESDAVDEVAAALAARLPEGLRLGRGATPAAGVEQAFAPLRLGLVIAGLTAVLAGAFLVHNVHAVSLAQRRPEIGTLMALGASRGQVMRAFVLEGLLLGLAGALPGVPLGHLISRAAVHALRDNLPMVGLPGDPEVTLPATHLLVLSVGVGVLAALSAVLLLAWPATRRPASTVLRARMEPGPAGGSGLAGSLLVGALLGSAAMGLLPGFVLSSPYVLIVVLGTSVALAGPSLTRTLFRPLAALTGGRIVPRLAARNLLRYPRRVGLTVGALALAVALAVQSGVVVTSFEARLLPWVRRSLQGDIFLLSSSPRIGLGRNQPLSWDFVEDLQSVKGVRKVTAGRGIFVPYGGLMVYLVGLEMGRYEDPGFLEWHAGSPEEAWPRVVEGEAVLVSDNFARLHDVQVGDRLQLPGLEGTYSLEVGGVVTDFSWSSGTLLVDRSVLLRHHATETVDLVSLHLREGVELQEVRSEVMARWGGSHDLYSISAAGFRRLITRELESFFGFAAAQELVVLLIAFLAVLDTVTLSVLARRRETRLLEAVGATPGQVRCSTLYESAAMAGSGALLGVLLGLVIATVLLRDLLFVTSGWRFHLEVPWTPLVLVLAGALTVGAAAGLFAARMGAKDVPRSL